MKGEHQVSFKGTTNTFKIGGQSIVLGVPKTIIDEMKIDVEKNKAYFKVFFNKKKKQIIYEFLEEEAK